MPDQPNTSLTIQVLINDSMDGIRRGYAPGDTFARALTYQRTLGDTTPGDTGTRTLAERREIGTQMLAEEAFALTNAPDELLESDQLAALGDYHRRFNSVSVGDVIVVGETALAVDRFGFKPVTLHPGAIGTDRIDPYGRQIKL